MCLALERSENRARTLHSARSGCGWLALPGPFRSLGNFPLTFHIHGRISSPDTSCSCSRQLTDMQNRDLPPQQRQTGPSQLHSHGLSSASRAYTAHGLSASPVWHLQDPPWRLQPKAQVCVTGSDSGSLARARNGFICIRRGFKWYCASFLEGLWCHEKLLFVEMVAFYSFLTVGHFFKLIRGCRL